MSPQSSGPKNKPSKKISVKAKRRLTFSGLHGDISPKIELFITTAVGTSGPTVLEETDWYP
jgi:hypothetical protein